MNYLEAYLEHTQYDGEDCIIIPISQIKSVDVTINSSTLEVPYTEMTLIVVGRRSRE